MKLVHFKTSTGVRFGVKTEGGTEVPQDIGRSQTIVDVQSALMDIHREGVPASLEELFSGGTAAMDRLQKYIASLAQYTPGAGWLLPEKGIVYAPCVPAPEKILCIGLNYRRHAAESGMATSTTPLLFSKFNNALAAHNESVPLDPNAEQYDYEAELVVVIGKRARFVSEADALDHVFGYCNGNDLSARDLQFRTSQWLLGKTPDKFMPVGPYLVTADEIKDVQALGVRCWVNGNPRQNSNTSDMVFTVTQLVSYISQYMTLSPGDLISTGTPEGVVFGMKEKVWLKAGDVVEIEIDGLGRLVNPMA